MSVIVYDASIHRHREDLLRNDAIFYHTNAHCILKRVKTIRDLGLFMDDQLSLHLHINNGINVASKGSIECGLNRTFRSLDFINRITKHFKQVKIFKFLLLFICYIHSRFRERDLEPIVQMSNRSNRKRSKDNSWKFLISVLIVKLSRTHILLSETNYLTKSPQEVRLQNSQQYGWLTNTVVRGLFYN